jgi:hypothetical protein
MNERAMKSGLLSVLVPLCHLTLAGCGPSLPRDAIVGSVTFERTEIGAGTSAFADECGSGIRQQFNGADLDGSGFSMRVLRTERKQPVVILTQAATNKTIELTAATCSVLDVYLFQGRGAVEKLRPGERLLSEEGRLYDNLFTSGSALFDCTTPAGGRARGSVSFRCGPR